MLFRLCERVERKAAYFQGKGYGTSTIEQEVRWVSQLLGRAPRLAVDIGGNIGNYTAELLKNTPELEIHVFEPSGVNIGRLRSRFQDRANVRLVSAAVSDSGGSATLYSNQPGSGLGSLTKRDLAHFGIAFDVVEPVRVVRFDQYWLDQLGRRPIDIVKIDIEGHELAALRGFSDAIHAVQILQFEFGGSNIDTRTFFRDLWHFFQENRFDLFRITPLGLDGITRYREADEFFSVTNFIAVNRAGT